MTDVLFVYGDPKGPHPSHVEFIKAINADTMHAYLGTWGNRPKRVLLAIKCALKYPKNYKYFILESFVPLLPAALYKLLKNKKIKLIGFFCDDSILNFVNRRDHYSMLDITAHKILSRNLDAGIAVSPMLKDAATKILKIPVEIARPYITKDNYRCLSNIRPNLELKTIGILGNARKNHGADILLKAFKIVSKTHKDLKLIIGGRNWPSTWKSNNVILPGYVDLVDFFANISLFVYPARGAAYPVVTLEAMRAGVPTIVSKYTGTRELVEKVSKKFKKKFGKNANLIVDIDPYDVAKSIEWYYNLEYDEKLFLSKCFKKITEEFYPERCARSFKKAFEKIVQQIS